MEQLIEKLDKVAQEIRKLQGINSQLEASRMVLIKIGEELQKNNQMMEALIKQKQQDKKPKKAGIWGATEY